MAKAPVIEDTQMRHAIKVVAVTGQTPARDVALLHVLYGTGMTATEVAQLEVADVLEERGELDRRRYRGLSPATPLIVTRRGAGFALNRKPRMFADGEVEDYWACDALQAHVSEWYCACRPGRVLKPHRATHVCQPTAGKGPRSRDDPAVAWPR